MKEVAFRRISTGSIFKIVFFGGWIGSLPVFLLLGILATFGVEIISWNEKYIIGPIALVGGPLLGLFFATILGAILGSLVALGLWIYSKFHNLTLFCDVMAIEESLNDDA